MTKNFADHFSAVAHNYADFRPTYPESLFAWLAEITPHHATAWDCACGSGQAARSLAAYFNHVIATDASQAQLDAAIPHPKVEYRLAAAEDSAIPPNTIDLITVAQALHWFQVDNFYREAKRVLASGGILAVWSYGMLGMNEPALNHRVHEFHKVTVGPYWPPEVRHVSSGYRSLPFPFTEITPPHFEMTASWTLPELLGYFRSWSSTNRYIKAKGADPVDDVQKLLVNEWGDPQTRRAVTWPLSLRVGH